MSAVVQGVRIEKKGEGEGEWTGWKQRDACLPSVFAFSGVACTLC